MMITAEERLMYQVIRRAFLQIYVANMLSENESFLLDKSDNAVIKLRVCTAPTDGAGKINHFHRLLLSFTE